MIYQLKKRIHTLLLGLFVLLQRYLSAHFFLPILNKKEDVLQKLFSEFLPFIHDYVPTYLEKLYLIADML